MLLLFREIVKIFDGLAHTIGSFITKELFLLWFIENLMSFRVRHDETLGHFGVAWGSDGAAGHDIGGG